MSLLLETSLGDITIDLDLEGSPLLCKNILKLAKARYYTSTLVYNVQEGRFCQMGDPRGDGGGGCCVDGLIDIIKNSRDKIDVRKSSKRFLRSSGRVLSKDELKEKGRVVAIEMGVKDTIGSQFMITIDSGEERALDGMVNLDEKEYLSLGMVSEDDDDVLGKINALYCDKGGRPYADVRVKRVHILDDPFDDPDGMDLVLSHNGVTLVEASDLPQKYQECARWLSSASPSYEKPKEEIVEIRVSTEEALKEVDEETEKRRTEEMAKKEDRSNAVMLEMLGDLPSADMKPPENVLFVCKLNPATDDEDLQLIFSRFDPNAKAEIIRDPDTGDSLQYAFIEFDTETACNEAYFKMNNALIDDRRIKVDFSQSVSKEWNRYAQKKRGGQSRDNFPSRQYGIDRRTNQRQNNTTERKIHKQYDSFGRIEPPRSRSPDRPRGREERKPIRHSSRGDRYERSSGHAERHRSRSSERSRDRRSSDRRYSRNDRDQRRNDRSRSRSFDRSRHHKSRSRSESTSSSRSRDRKKKRRRRQRSKDERRRRHRDHDRDRRKKRHKSPSRKRER